MASDLRSAIQNKFFERNRFANFGNAITRMHVKGFRCHTDTLIEFRSPITAFCGLNGSGKSTVLQLAAAAYSSPDPDQLPQFSISDFMVVGTLDPAPFEPDASVEFKYWRKDRSLKTTTISRDPSYKNWRNYDGRPERYVFFAGVGYYLPKIEQRDFVVRYAKQMSVVESQSVPEEVHAWTSTIVSSSYDAIMTNAVSLLEEAGQKTERVVSATRQGISYSEAHMGYGEGRTLFMVSTLESLPPRSLVLIEEPETSLHPSAQHQLGRYLVDVVNRKQHQVLLTTHSMFLLSALPGASIVYLKRRAKTVDVVRNLSHMEVRSLLADGHVKALHVLVEDDVAQCVLREIIRRGNPDFLRVIDIQPGSGAGGANALSTAVRELAATQLPVACVLDGDQRATPRDNIFKLPGDRAPERELFDNEAVKTHVREEYDTDLDDFCTSLAGVDHHQWFSRLAGHCSEERTTLLSGAARAYARTLSETDVEGLIQQLKEASL